MKPAKRQARKLAVPTDPTLTITLDSGASITLDRQPDPEGVPGQSPAAAYMGHGFLVMITRSIHPEHGPLLHASMSHISGQLPHWYHLKALKQALFPDDVAAIVPLPEASSYVNIAECLHIIQAPGPWGNL